jgi:hypothetical protein
MSIELERIQQEAVGVKGVVEKSITICINHKQMYGT